MPEGSFFSVISGRFCVDFYFGKKHVISGFEEVCLVLFVNKRNHKLLQLKDVSFINVEFQMKSSHTLIITAKKKIFSELH